MGIGNTNMKQNSEDIQGQSNYDLILDQQNPDKELYAEEKEKIIREDLLSIVTGKNDKNQEDQMTCINEKDSKSIQKHAKSKIKKIKKKIKKKISNKKKQKQKYDSPWILHFKELIKNLIETKIKNRKIIIKRKCFQKFTTNTFKKGEKIMRKAHKIRIILPGIKTKKIVSLISIINWRFFKKNRKKNICVNNTVHTINNNMNSINYIEAEEFNDLEICNYIEEEEDDITPNAMSMISLIERTNIQI